MRTLFMASLSPAFHVLELMQYQLSFLSICELWSLQMTCQLNSLSVRSYLSSKYSRYLNCVLANTCGTPSVISYLCHFNILTGGSYALFSYVLDLTGSVIVDNFALAMMADECQAQAWTFDSLTIIVPIVFLPIFHQYFADLEYQYRIALLNAPHVTAEDIYSYSVGNMAPPDGQNGIEIIISHGSTLLMNIADLPSTILASFITPSGIFCAYLRLTFNQYALSMNSYPTYPVLYSHYIFGYDFQFTNENWDMPCGNRCPSGYRHIYQSLAILPFHPVNSTLLYFDMNLWWRIRANCMNLNCPFIGTYI
jgi:hypothetical protein